MTPLYNIAPFIDIPSRRANSCSPWCAKSVHHASIAAYLTTSGGISCNPESGGRVPRSIAAKNFTDDFSAASFVTRTVASGHARFNIRASPLCTPVAPASSVATCSKSSTLHVERTPSERLSAPLVPSQKTFTVQRPRGGRRETTGEKVLKDRRSPRERGRMGTSARKHLYDRVVVQQPPQVLAQPLRDTRRLEDAQRVRADARAHLHEHRRGALVPFHVHGYHGRRARPERIPPVLESMPSAEHATRRVEPRPERLVDRPRRLDVRRAEDLRQPLERDRRRGGVALLDPRLGRGVAFVVADEDLPLGRSDAPSHLYTPPRGVRVLEIPARPPVLAADALLERLLRAVEVGRHGDGALESDDERRRSV
eukprot:31078-Pelagococcus_subviridis.AAC.4